MFFEYFYTLVLALIQGITEFIPVSSSSHLILFSKGSQFSYESLELDIGLHLGSLIAILLYFKKDLIEIKKNKNLVSLLFFGSLPLFIVGYFMYYTGLIDYLRNITIIAWSTLIFGIMLYIADKSKINKKIDIDLNLKNIIFIGMFQCLALIPGVSRSGITITSSRLIKFNRLDAAKISFYLSIPAIAGASFLTLKDLGSSIFDINIIIIFGIFLSFIFSYLTIKYFLIYIKNFTLLAFIIYRVILSFILFYIIYI